MEEAIALPSRSHLDPAGGDEHSEKGLEPSGKRPHNRRPPMLSRVEQACSEILGSEFSVFVQVCLEKAAQARIQCSMGFQADVEPSRMVGKEPI